MEPREIPIEQWPQSLEQFSRIHRGKPARVSTSGAGAEAGARANAEDLPLIGVTDERPAEGDRERIHVVLGAPAAPHVDHVIARPSKLRLAEWNDGYSALLEIESDEGWLTTVRVGPQEQLVPPGMILDGFVP